MVTDVTDPVLAPETTSAPSPEVVQVEEALGKLEQLKGLIGEMPAADQARVLAIKKAIADGTYPIDPTTIAQKLLEMEALLAEVL